MEKPDIYNEFHNLLSQVPEGCVSTYGDIALQLGDIIASRAVWEMLNEETDPARYHCYRIVGGNGSIGNRNHFSSPLEKIRKLREEGIRVSNGKIESFNSLRFDSFISDFPLKKFRKTTGGSQFEESSNFPTSVRAMDISYKGRKGVGVAVDFDKRISFEVVTKDVKAPYIPNYLYLREGEIYESLCRKDRLNVIDGNGILHRDGFGVATLVGISRDVSTVGIAKNLLMGKVMDDSVLIENKVVGRKHGRYYLSAGNKTELDGLYKVLTSNKYFPQTKYPDRISRRYVNEILPFRHSI